MAKTFYSSKKKGRALPPRRSSDQTEIFDQLSRKMETWPSQRKASLLLGAFFLFFFLGVFLAAFLNPATVSYLARVGKLPGGPR